MMCGEYLVAGTRTGSLNLFKIVSQEYNGLMKNPSIIINNTDNDQSSISAII
jgi:hypothetical protein